MSVADSTRGRCVYGGERTPQVRRATHLLMRVVAPTTPRFSVEYWDQRTSGNDARAALSIARRPRPGRRPPRAGTPPARRGRVPAPVLRAAPRHQTGRPPARREDRAGRRCAPPPRRPAPASQPASPPARRRTLPRAVRDRDEHRAGRSTARRAHRPRAGAAPRRGSPAAAWQTAGRVVSPQPQLVRAPYISWGVVPLQSRVGRIDTWARDELAEHAVALCRLLHRSPDPRRCTACAAILGAAA